MLLSVSHAPPLPSPLLALPPQALVFRFVVTVSEVEVKAAMMAILYREMDAPPLVSSKQGLPVAAVVLQPKTPAVAAQLDITAQGEFRLFVQLEPGPMQMLQPPRAAVGLCVETASSV